MDGHTRATGRGGSAAAANRRARLAGARDDEREAEILLRMAAGEAGAPVRELYDRFGRGIYALGHRMLGDRQHAEDLVQESFVRIWRSVGRFDPARGTARAFVMTIAKRTAIDALRRRAVRPSPATLAEETVPDDGAVATLERIVEGLAVREALAGLSADHREVLGLAYLAGMTQAEIAEHLAVPVGTVKARTSRALARMRAQLPERDLAGGSR